MANHRIRYNVISGRMHTFVDPFLHFILLLILSYGVNLIRYAHYYIPCEQSGNRIFKIPVFLSQICDSFLPHALLFQQLFLCCLCEIISSTFTAMKFAWLEVAALASVANANVSRI